MKKKLLSTVLSVAMATSLVSLPSHADDSRTEAISYNYVYSNSTGYSDDNTHTRQMEKLGRGLVAISVEGGVYLCWRLFDSEDNIYGSADKNVSFNVYRGNEKIATVETATNYTDTTAGSSYSVAPVINGVEGEKCEAVSVMDASWFDIPITKPETETVTYLANDVESTIDYSFSPADCSTGDLDGDGEYEIIVKWTSAEKDVGSPGDPAYSGTVRLAAYKLDGTRLWADDINLGKNIYSSAHTLQFLVYDFNSDGKAEVICQTSLGSKDASGTYVSHAAATGTDIAAYTDSDNETADFRSANWGLITSGVEFLTVFNGETGSAIDTIDLPTKRETAEGDNGASFGDTSGNRSNRFIADVAYLDGENPYAVFMRGYYFGRNGRQRTSIAGVSFDGERLSADYRFDTEKGMPGYYDGAEIYVGNGNHNCSVADVDNDGKDEFITGALCMEVNDKNEFKPLWCTFMEHGDALHIGDYDPTNEGIEFFTVHEDLGPNTMSGQEVIINYGMSVIDAKSGTVLYHETAGSDTGRGVMADVGSDGYYQIWSAGNSAKASNGGTNFVPSIISDYSMNFRVFWDGDLYDELLDGVKLTNWNGSTMVREVLPTNTEFYAINGTKANPALQADLFGDWREELVYPVNSGDALRVFSTTQASEYKMKTLMHDPVYRSGVAAQQTAYNQPPHVGFYLDEEVFLPEAESVTAEITKSLKVGDTLRAEDIKVTVEFDDGTSTVTDKFSFSGYNKNAAGEQTLTIVSYKKSITLTINVMTDFVIEDGVVTGYNGTDTSAIIPQSNNGTEVTAIAAGALNDTSITEITIPFNIKTIGTNALPVNSKIICVEGSAAHEYAVANNLETELSKNFLESFVNETYADMTESFKHGGTDINQTLNGILYHVGSRTSKGQPAGDGQTGFVISDGVINAAAGRFEDNGRHAYMQFGGIPKITESTDYVFSADICFNTPTVDGSAMQMIVASGVSPSLNDNETAVIDSITQSGLGVEYDKYYTYRLMSYNGVYYRIILNPDGTVFAPLQQLTSAVDTAPDTLTFHNSGSKVSNNQSVSMNLDNIQVYSCSSTLGKAEIAVKLTNGTPVANANVSINGKNYTTNVRGIATTDLLLNGMYEFTASNSANSAKGAVYIADETNVATVYFENETNYETPVIPEGAIEYASDPKYTDNTVKVSLKNTSEEAVSLRVITAVFDNGKLVESKISPTTINAASQKTVAVKLSSSSTDIRIFVWADTISLQPVLESKTLN